MLTAYRSLPGGGTAAIAADEVPALLADPHTAVWIDADSPSVEEVAFLERQFDIHHLTLEDVVKQNQRAKIETFEHYAYLVVHVPQRVDGTRIEPTEVDLLAGRNWFVIVHYGPVAALGGNHKQHERLLPALGRGVDFLLYTVVDLVVDAYFPVLDEIDELIGALEERLVERDSMVDMRELVALRRALVTIRRTLGPHREIFGQLAHRQLPFIRPEYAVYFRDVSDHLIRIVEELDTYRDILSGALEIHLAAVSNQLNAVMKRLTAWATILIVITTIAGIYGMNFHYMPELGWRYGYPWALGLMATISLGLYLYFRRRGYF
jgi:magnesium transporter